MAASRTTEKQAATAGSAANEVRLVGRLSQAPQERILPSGDVLWTFRVVVPRGDSSGTGRQGVDALDCAVWTGRLRRSVAGWAEDDVVEVRGSMRRRFYRAGASTTSRVEIEVSSGRIIRRAASG